LYDSPHAKQATTLKQLSEISKGKMDLVLMCVACVKTIDLKDHEEVIGLLTKQFGEDFWRRTVFVMTFVNTMRKDYTTHNTFLDDVKCELKSGLSQALQSIKCSKAEADQIAESVPCLTAGKVPGNLPHEREDWNQRLFLHCLKRVDPDRVPTLLQVRYGAQMWSNVLSVIGYGVVRAAGGGATAAGIGAGIGALIGVLGGPVTVPIGASVGAAIGGGVGAVFGVAIAMDPSSGEMEIIRRVIDGLSIYRAKTIIEEQN
jgi:hypothetical protein